MRGTLFTFSGFAILIATPQQLCSSISRPPAPADASATASRVRHRPLHTVLALGRTTSYPDPNRSYPTGVTGTRGHLCNNYRHWRLRCDHFVHCQHSYLKLMSSRHPSSPSVHYLWTDSARLYFSLNCGYITACVASYPRGPFPSSNDAPTNRTYRTSELRLTPKTAVVPRYAAVADGLPHIAAGDNLQEASVHA